MEKFVREMLQRAEAAEQLNKLEPQARPEKPRSMAEMAHEQELARKKKQQEAGHNFNYKQHFINGKNHFSVKPLEELEPIMLAEMQVPFVHSGRVLPCRVIAEGDAKIGLTTLVEDPKGRVEHLGLYNFSDDLNDASWLQPGTILLIKEPFLKYSAASLDVQKRSVLLHVDSPTDVIFVPPSDRQVLRKVRAECWYTAEPLLFDQLKASGNDLFCARDYKGALRFYERAQAVADAGSPEAAVLALDMAKAQLQIGHFEEAKKSAEKALEGGADPAKALFRRGKAAYGLRRWAQATEAKDKEAAKPQAIEDFEAALTKLSGKKDEKLAARIQKLLDRAKARNTEATTGVYDMAKIVKATCGKEQGMKLDLADYKGPVEVVDVHGKGRGLELTAPVKKGTLLLASKAFSIASPKPKELILCMDLLTKKAEKARQLHCIVRAIQRLRREPSTAPKLYDLWAGKGANPPPEGVIDAGRVASICKFNTFGAGEGVGLWLLPSYMNHSCIANTHRSIFGDMMFVHALVDLKKGDELTTIYAQPMDFYSKRKSELSKWGFQCGCGLCQQDKKDSKERERVELNAKLDALKGAFDQIGDLRAVLTKMQGTYESRDKFCIHLSRPLFDIGAALQSEATRLNESKHKDEPVTAGNVKKYLNEAAALLKEALEAVPQPLCYHDENQPFLQIMLGLIFLQQPDLDKAKEWFNKGLQLERTISGVGDFASFKILHAKDMEAFWKNNTIEEVMKM